MIVRLIAARPRPNDPQLSITISVKVTSLQENVEVLMQGAQTAITAAGIESQGDLASGLESGVSHLEGTLKSIVDVIIGKMDVMAEVRRALESCLHSNSNLTAMSISFIPMPILPGRRALLCIG